ncbi:telomere repeat-binding factor 4-like [Tripterygium wilfordii]|uniref:MYB transcription factor n=1 Tax=Tripterygium wilfordii TaxID=458696 RepID=A0A7J7BW22_TRIWF|nr:telomere repeat-binding factor 4-like [Tripterygium wilfordii]KAF5726071.1 telomere repeat-binding factor 4-like [Tripterygium wilfordii]
MGNPKQKWTAEEEDALMAGIAKHGTGKWKNIQRDPEFHPFLSSRSNVDLKDKWRNMNVNAGGQGSREKSRAPKPIVGTDGPVPAAPLVSNSQTSDPAASVASDALADLVVDESIKSSGNGKDASRYNTLIFEALSSLNVPHGSGISEIVSYIEQRQEVPPNFRRLLSSRLRRMVAQEKLEKAENGYKLKNASLGGKTPSTNLKEVGPRQLQSTGFITSNDNVEEAVSAAAYRIAEAENKSFVASEAVKEAERVSKLSEDADSLQQLAKEISEKCSRGEIVFVE